MLLNRRAGRQVYRFDDTHQADFGDPTICFVSYFGVRQVRAKVSAPKPRTYPSHGLPDAKISLASMNLTESTSVNSIDGMGDVTDWECRPR